MTKTQLELGRDRCIVVELAESDRLLGTQDNLLTDIRVAWRAGDMTALDRRTNKDLRESGVPGLYEMVIVRRNHQIARAIDRLIATGEPLFVVGAAHLAGPDSVQRALRRYGWTATRVDYE